MRIRFQYTSLSKLCVAVFLLYLNWYKEAYSNVNIILYASVIMMVLFLVLSKVPINLKLPVVSRTFISFGLFSLVTGVFVSIDRGLFFSSMMTYFEFLIVLLVCIYISNEEQSMDWLFNIMILVAVLCALQTVFAGVSYRNGVIVTTMSYHNNPNSLGMVMIFGLFSLTHRHEKMRHLFLLRLLTMILFLYVIVLCGSRKCLIAGVAFVAVWFVLFIRNQGKDIPALKKFGYISIALAGVGFIVFYFYTKYAATASFQRMTQLETGESTIKRIEFYKDAKLFFLESPLVGIGFDQYRRWSSYGLYSHSTYAEVFACSGLIGTLIFFVPFVRQTYGMSRCLIRNRANRKRLYDASMLMLAFLVEVFMGSGNIWIYGFTHMEMLLCIFWSYEQMRGMEYA